MLHKEVNQVDMLHKEVNLDKEPPDKTGTTIHRPLKKYELLAIIYFEIFVCIMI